VLVENNERKENLTVVRVIALFNSTPGTVPALPPGAVAAVHQPG